MTHEATAFQAIANEASSALARCMVAERDLLKKPELFRAVFERLVIYCYTEAGYTLTDSQADQDRFIRFCDKHVDDILSRATEMYTRQVLHGINPPAKKSSWLPKVGAFVGGVLLSSLF